MIGESFHAIRKWSADNVAPKPDCAWAEISISGFCALHALVEEESRVQGLLGNTWWTQRTIVAVESGANPRWVGYWSSRWTGPRAGVQSLTPTFVRPTFVGAKSELDVERHRPAGIRV